MVENDRTAFVMGRINFDFVGPAAYGDKIVTRRELLEISNSTLLWQCTASRREDDRTVTHGTATRVYAEIQQDGSLKAIRITDHIRRLLGATASSGPDSGKTDSTNT